MINFLKLLFLAIGYLFIPSIVSSSVVYSNLNIRAASPEIIFQASVEALKKSDIEKAAYLFYAARLRAFCDQQLFPPKAEGGDNPFILFGALSQVIGEDINPKITNDPQGYKRVIDRINVLNPVPEIGYKPTWEYKSINNVAEAKCSCLSSKKEFIQLYQRQSKLLLNKEYFSIFNRIKAYNLSSSTTRANSDERLIKKDILKLKEIEVKEFGDSFLWNLLYAE